MKILLPLLSLVGLLPFLMACSDQPRPATSAGGAGGAGRAPSTGSPAVRDPHSFSHPDEVAVDHLKLDLGVDFEKRQLNGRASLRLNNRTGASRLFLDTRDLTVQRVTLDEGVGTQFRMGEAVEFLGRPLEIDIRPETKWVHVEYTTSPEAAALQWLDPEQTAAGARPFLLTQSQAILARTWVPCQDSPGVRMTYEATVRVPKDLLAVMSAENPTKKNDTGVYQFRMPQRIPSYLLALAVGDLEFRPLGNRAGVYAEPTVIEQAAWEMADTPKMIDAAERLYGPYQWGRYDLLILPPSFPFGGMENPRLTFATPTILARDRSLVSLVAHELAHSWSGNLVTNATWNDFWLNEGFTTYFENRIMEALYGKEYADMLAVLGRGELEQTIEEIGKESPDTALFLRLAGRDPDEGMTEIAYEKGALFLRTLEQAVGRARFDKFLRTYFDTHAFQTMDTARFLPYLKQNLFGGSEERMRELQVEQWVNGPGIPANAVQVRSAAFGKVDEALAALAQGTAPKDLQTQGWTTHHWLHFLRNLPKPLDRQRMADLDGAFKFTQSNNSEILSQWLLLVIQNRYEPSYAALDRFLTEVGRRKFLKPLYTELAKSPEGTERALRIYKKARPGYHSVSRQTIDEILDWRG